MKKFLSISFLSLLISATVAWGKEEVFKDKDGMDCYLYTPEKIEPERVYQLVVGVHALGGNGKGAAELSSWAQRGDVIVIGPSFISQGADPYQKGDRIHAEKLLDLQKKLQKKYKLREQMFLHGFSAGAQFVHRYAMNHPKTVCGVSAHSAGSWASDNYGRISSGAKEIPFAISCGENDTSASNSQAAGGRLELFGKFRKKLDQKNFIYLAKTWPGVGHEVSSGARAIMRECFQISTGLPGKSATEKVEISAEWKNLPAIGNLDSMSKESVKPSPTNSVEKVGDEESEKARAIAFRQARE